VRIHKPSPAFVVAIMALFVALGSTSYAALRVGSAQIANNSVRSKDLRNNDVRGRDIRQGTVRGTDIRDGDLQGRDLRGDTITGAKVKEETLAKVPSAASADSAANAQNAETLGGKAASAFLGSDKQVRTGLIKLAQGETKTIASYGPFTWEAECSDDAGGNTGLTVTLETTEADSFAGDFGGGGQPVSPGSPVTLFNASDSASHYTIGFPLSAVAPSGAAPVGLGFVGLNVLDADCAINGILWP
jgi:hypothetical protein